MTIGNENSDVLPGPGGTNPIVSDDGKNPKNEENKRSVSYETYLKTLDEAKTAKSKLKAHEDELNKVRDEKMKADGDWKGLLETRENRIRELESTVNETSGKYETLNERILNSQKLSKVIGKLGGSIDEKYFGLIDISEIKINPETNEVDDMSVMKVAENYRLMYPETIKKSSNTRMMGDGNSGNGSQSLTYEAWLKLPYGEKNKRIKDVINK